MRLAFTLAKLFRQEKIEPQHLPKRKSRKLSAHKRQLRTPVWQYGLQCLALVGICYSSGTMAATTCGTDGNHTWDGGKDDMIGGMYVRRSATCQFDLNGTSLSYITTDDKPPITMPLLFVFPDADLDADSTPARVYAQTENTNTVLPTITCAAATITPNTDSVQFALDDGESCELNVSGNVGTADAEVILTGTLSRSGQTYSIASATVCGAPFDSCSDTGSNTETTPEETVAAPLGTICGTDGNGDFTWSDNDNSLNIGAIRTSDGTCRFSLWGFVADYVTEEVPRNMGGPIEIVMPDSDPDADLFPPTVYIVTEDGTYVAPTIDCESATITPRTSSVQIDLDDGESCPLTISANSGTNGDEVRLTGRLSRSGKIYSIASATICGAPFDSCPDTGSNTETTPEETAAALPGTICGTDGNGDFTWSDNNYEGNIGIMRGDRDGSCLFGRFSASPSFITEELPIGSGNDTPLELFMPDTAPDADLFPPSVYTATEESTYAAPTIDCESATITPRNNSVQIDLDDGESCPLTISVNTGTNGGEVRLTGTLSRSGKIYSIASAIICGAPFDSCSDSGSDTDTTDAKGKAIAETESGVQYLDTAFRFTAEDDTGASIHNRTLDTSTELNISMNISFDPTHQNISAELYVLVGWSPINSDTMSYFMREAGQWQAWEIGNANNFGQRFLIDQAFDIDASLQKTVNIYQGALPMPGNFYIWVAYRLADGTLVHNGAEPLVFNIE